MIDLGRLRALAAVATHGTVHQAAAALHCTPSAVSQHLAKLEREMRMPMFVKHGRLLRLTDAGALLAEHAAGILAAVETAESALEAHRGAVAGHVTLAAFATACRALAPTVLRRLGADHPDLAVTLLETDHRAGVEQLVRGEADVAVVDDWPEVPARFPERLSHELLGHDSADLVVPAGHPLAGRESVRLSELAGERWIASMPGSTCHTWYAQAIPGIAAACHVSEFESQYALVAAGLGVAMSPRLARNGTPPGTVVVGLDPVPRRRVHLVWRTATASRPPVTALLDALREAWKGLEPA